MHSQPWCVNICLYFRGRIPRGGGERGPAYQKSHLCADVGEQRWPPEGCGCILGTPEMCSDSPGAGRALTAWWAEATGGASLFCPWSAWYAGSGQHCTDSSRGCRSCAVKVLPPTRHPSAVVSVHHMVKTQCLWVPWEPLTPLHTASAQQMWVPFPPWPNWQLEGLLDGQGNASSLWPSRKLKTEVSCPPTLGGLGAEPGLELDSSPSCLSFPPPSPLVHVKISEPK